MASADEINSTLKGVVVNLAGEVAAVNAVATAVLTTSASSIIAMHLLGTTIASAIAAVATAIYSTFPRINGTFTLANATITVVTQPATAANSIVHFTPTNATAALTQRTNGLFHSANVAGASFSLSTQAGSALGTETLEYILFNPS